METSNFTPKKSFENKPIYNEHSRKKIQEIYVAKLNLTNHHPEPHGLWKPTDVTFDIKSDKKINPYIRPKTRAQHYSADVSVASGSQSTTIDASPWKNRPKRTYTPEYYQEKYEKPFSTMVAEDSALARDYKRLSYGDVAAPPIKEPPIHLCTTCGFISKYKCITCGIGYCSVDCQKLHNEQCYKLRV